MQKSSREITKLGTLNGAYAEELDLAAYGNCRGEALSNLSGEIIQQTSDALPR